MSVGKGLCVQLGEGSQPCPPLPAARPTAPLQTSALWTWSTRSPACASPMCCPAVPLLLGRVEVPWCSGHGTLVCCLPGPPRGPGSSGLHGVCCWLLAAAELLLTGDRLSPTSPAPSLPAAAHRQEQLRSLQLERDAWLWHGPWGSPTLAPAAPPGTHRPVAPLPLSLLARRCRAVGWGSLDQRWWGAVLSPQRGTDSLQQRGHGAGVSQHWHRGALQSRNGVRMSWGSGSGSRGLLDPDEHRDLLQAMLAQGWRQARKGWDGAGRGKAGLKLGEAGLGWRQMRQGLDGDG